MPTESDNPSTEPPCPRKRIGKSTLFAIATLFVAWALVAIPGHSRNVRPLDDSDNPKWRGKGVFHTFGWPYVHAAKLSVKPTINEENSGSQTDGVAWQATQERYDASLQSLHWSNSPLFSETSQPPTLMPAKPFTQLELTSPYRQRFWSNPQNWQYWQTDALTRWYVCALLTNGLVLLLFLSFVTLCLESLRRRRKRWFQLSLIDFLAFVLIVGIATSFYMHEQRLDEKHMALSERATAGNFPGVTPRLRLESPVLLSRLIDGIHGWRRWIPEKAFYRLCLLKIDTTRIETESELKELVALLKSDLMDYVKRLSIKIVGEDRFFILDLLPTDNVATVRIQLQLEGNPPIGSSKNDALKKLERFRELESLTIECDWDRFEYPNLPWLKHVDFDWVNDSDGRGRDWLASMQDLESVLVKSDDLESCLKQLPTSVRSLEIKALSDQIDLSSLNRLKQLESLTGFSHAQTRITGVPELPNLKRLNLLLYRLGDGKPQIDAFRP